MNRLKSVFCFLLFLQTSTQLNASVEGGEDSFSFVQNTPSIKQNMNLYSDTGDSYDPITGALSFSVPGFNHVVKPFGISTGLSLPNTIDNTEAVKITTVIGPDSKKIYYIDRNIDSIAQNKIIAVDSLSLAGDLLRREENYYQKGQPVGEHWGIIYAAYDGVSNTKYRPPSENPDQAEYRANLISKVVKLGADIYTTDFQDFGGFGLPGKIIESNNFSSHKRYIKQGYKQEAVTGILNLPTTTEVSGNDFGYITAKEIIYHDFSNTGLYQSWKLPYEIRTFGTWVKRYKSYHSDGNVNRVEFNKRLIKGGVNGSGNRFRTYSNYKRGIAQTITMPKRYDDVATMSFSRVVDSNGWVTRITDLNGNITNYGYDKIGRLKYVDTPSGWKDSFVLWRNLPTGELTQTIKKCTLTISKNNCATGSETLRKTNTFDSLYRTVLIEEKDVNTNYSRYQNITYNSSNQPIFTSRFSAIPNETTGITNVYDDLQRLSSISEAYGGTITTEYLNQNRTRITDAEGNQTVTTFLSYGEPNYSSATKIISPESVITTQNYDVFGNITSITQQGPNKSGGGTLFQTENRYYDSQKNLCLIKRNDIGDTAYVTNVIGEVEWIDRRLHSGTACLTGGSAGVMPLFAYDNLGDIRKKYFWGQAPDVTYNLDNNGNLKTLTAGSVVHSYNYNSLDLLEDETLALDGKSLLLDYQYDSDANLSGLIYPDGDHVTYAPNAFGQPTRALRSRGGYSYASNAIYYPNGGIDSFSYGNGFTHKTTLNNRNLPSDIEDSIGTKKAIHFAYTYDNNSNISSLNNYVNTSYSLTSLRYDGLDRLVGITGNSGIGSSTLQYDGLGNITTYNSKASQLDYSYDTTRNRLNRVYGTGGASKNYNFTSGYDDQGNVVNNGHRTFVYNLANQMVSSGAYTYLYDGHNRRVKQQDAAGTSYSMYSQSGRLLYRENNVDTNTNVGVGANYIFLGGKLIAKDGVLSSSSSKKSYYKPFGEDIGAPKDDVGYTGHKFDADLGLSYMQARYYDPVIGRFYSNDPVGYIAENPVMSFNRYLYVNNNPYKYTDPTGKILQPVGTATQISKINTALGKIESSNPKSAARMTTLRKSSNVHTIRFPKPGESPQNKTTGIRANESNGIGTGSETILDPTKTITTTNSDGTKVTSSGETVLAHEILGHGLDKDNGVMDRSINPSTGERRSEESAMGAENEYKDSVGEKRRDCHSNC